MRVTTAHSGGGSMRTKKGSQDGVKSVTVDQRVERNRQSQRWAVEQRRKLRRQQQSIQQKWEPGQAASSEEGTALGNLMAFGREEKILLERRKR